MLFFGSRLSSRSNHLRRFALAVEPLETRRMLSVVGLGVTLFEDLGGGTVGGEIAGDTVQPGQSFFAQITAEDLRESPTTAGIVGLTIDVNWDTSFLTEIDSQASFDSMAAPLVTADFPELRDGTLSNTAGTIIGLTGHATPGTAGSAIGVSAAEEFSLLHFQALANLGSTYIDVTSDSVTFADGETSSVPVNVSKTFSVAAAVNQAPTAEGNSTVNTTEDTYIDIDLWDHAADLETADADLTFTVTDTADGQAAMLADHHTVRFTPAADFNGMVSFKFSVSDTATPPQTPQYVELTLNVDVAAVNDAPVAIDDTAVTDATVAIDTATSTTNDGVLENDTDIDGDTLTVTAYDAASSRGAAVTVNPDGSYTYDPNGVADFSALSPGESLDDTFSYTISDAGSETATATVTITVYATAATQAVALDDEAETDEDSNATGNVLDNDQIASGGLALTITNYNTTSSKGASVSIDASGNFVYNPTGVATLQALAVGETATDTFTYTIEDEADNTDTATVTITITGVNDGPTAVNDTKAVDADKISAGNVLANDTDPDSSDVLSVVPNTGTTSRGAAFEITANGSFVYNPTVSAELLALSSGQVADSFTYEISDGHGGTDTATVTVTVNCVNDAPTAVDDTAATDADTSKTGNVLANDSDPDTGDSISVSAFDATSTKGATVTIGQNGNYTYDPSGSATLKALAPSETVEDTFTYTVRDQGGKTTTATVTVTVTGVDDAPTAIDDNGSTTEETNATGNLFTNDTEHDPGDSFSLKTFDATSAKGATVTVDAAGNYTYNPTSAGELQALAVDGTTTDTFTYTIEDQQGNETTATVTITISGENDAPTAVDDTAATNKDMLAVGNVLDNDTDPDTGDTFTVTAFDATSAEGATVSVNSDGTFTYDPTSSATLQALDSGTTDTDTFTYTIDDGHGGTSTATMTVTVSGDEGLPVANDDTASTDENTPITGNVLTNDQVPIGRTPAVTAFDASSGHGAVVSVAADGSFTYNPGVSSTLGALGDGQSLIDTFDYTISDGEGNTATATVTITVNGVSDAPAIANNTGAIVDVSETVTIGIGSLRTTDPDSATADLTYTLTAAPGHGVLKNNGTALSAGNTFTQQDIDNNLIEYTRGGDSTTDDLFKFTVSDGTTTLDEATFNLTLARNSLGGFVYVDYDNDGIKDAGEIGLGSVNVILTGVDSSGGAVARSIWTAADGSYKFEDLPAGVYELAMVQPENFVNGKETAGSEGGTIANGRITNIDISSNNVGSGYNFGQTGLQKRMISRQLFLASTPSTSVVFQQAVGSEKTAVEPQTDPVVSRAGNTVTVTGTDGDDTVELRAGTSQHTLIVNGQSHGYNTGDVTAFNFNAGDGTDFVTLYGTDGDETAVMRSGSATFSGTNLAVNVTEAERILIDAKGGDDEATIYDSLGNDSLRADGAFAMISGDDFVNWAFNFEKATAKSAAGRDTSDVGTLTDLVLAKEGHWTEL